MDGDIIRRFQQGIQIHQFHIQGLGHLLIDIRIEGDDLEPEGLRLGRHGARDLAQPGQP